MSVKKEASGRRSIQAEVEVPARRRKSGRRSPPARESRPGRLDGVGGPRRQNGRGEISFGPGMDAVASIRAGSRRRRLSRAEKGGSPPVATEWIVGRARAALRRPRGPPPVRGQKTGTASSRAPRVGPLLPPPTDLSRALPRSALGRFKQLMASVAGTEAEGWETLVAACWG